MSPPLLSFPVSPPPPPPPITKFSLPLSCFLPHTHAHTDAHTSTYTAFKQGAHQKLVISLIHSDSLETQCRLTSVLYTPYIRKMKRPCKQRKRERERETEKEWRRGGGGGEETGSRTKLLDVFSLIHFSEHNFENCTSCISSRSIVEVRRENRLNSKYEGEFKFNCFLLGYIFNHPLVDFV